jgi:molecular chaperone DnaK
MAPDNRTLGKFHLMGIPPAPRGMPQVEVTFDIDANGILNVSAKDMATSKEQKITITASTGLSKDEAEKMRREAESHSDEDRRKFTEVEARNTLDSRVYQMEKLIRENREKLAEGDVKPVEAAIESAKSALASGNLENIQSAIKELEGASHKLAEVLYRASAAAGAAGAGGGQGGPGAPGAAPGGQQSEGSTGQKDGEVIDAEYVDVDESKKPN